MSDSKKATEDDAYEDEAPDDVEPITDQLKYTLEYNFKHHRYDEDSQKLRDLSASRVAECPDAACPSRGKTGGGPRACQHTFPFELRPDDALKRCARCGMERLDVLFVKIVAEGELFLKDNRAVLYTHRVCIPITVYTAVCQRCKAVFWPFLREQGLY